MAAPSFFNRAWPSKVIDELMDRASIIPDEYSFWTHGRMPWIKMTSNVQVNGDRKLREKKQLFSGNLNTLTNSYDLENRSEPMPGITSLNVKDQGTAGALRKATIEFKCWSMEQIKYIEPLYMSLGTYVVVEWGWSTKSNGERNTSYLTPDQMLGSQCEFAKLVKERQVSSHFNYDALKGKVSNFSWSVNNVGGFDCSLELISMGTVLMSTPTNTTSMTNKCKDSDDDKEATETAKAEEMFPNSYAVMVFVYQEMVAGEPFEVPGISGKPAFAGLPIAFDKDIEDDEKEKDLDSESYNQDLSYYVTWDYFEEHIINRFLIPEISEKSDEQTGQTSGGGSEACCSGKEADLIQDVEGNETAWNAIYKETKALMPHLVDRRTVGVGALDSRGTIIKNHPFLVSSNPMVCILPGQAHWDGYEEDTNWASDTAGGVQGYYKAKSDVYKKNKEEGKEEGNFVKQAINFSAEKIDGAKSWAAGVAADVLADDNVSGMTVQPLTDSGLLFATDPARKEYGILSNMLLNVRFLQNTLSEVETLAEYINKICDSVNESCSDYFDLQLIEDPDVPAIMRVVDGNVHGLKADVIVPVIPSVGKGSMCRELSIETKLSGPIAAQVMYGTSKKSTAHDMGTKGTSKWNMWNAEVIDMDHANIKMADKTEKGVNACESGEGELDSEDTQKTIKESYIESRKDLADNVAKEQIEACLTATKKRIELANTVVVDGVSTDASWQGVMLPLEIGLTLDGMSGIIWGYPISVDYLPPRYDASAFTITTVDHKIDDTGWTVAVGTVMRPGVFATTGIEDKSPPPETSTVENNTANTTKTEEVEVEEIPEEETDPVEEVAVEEEESVEEEEEKDAHFDNKHYDVNTMTISPAGVDAIKKFEGFRENAYQDSVGIWTIGYGTTEAALGRPVTPGMTMSEEVASNHLTHHLNSSYEPSVKRYVTADVTQGEFDAMVSFVYNLGSGSFKNSTLLKKFNNGDHEGTAEEFKRWNKAGGKVLAGLTSRRNEEKKTFLDQSIPKHA